MNAIVMVGTLPYQKSYNLCDLLKDVDITCPVKSGKLSFGIKLKVPEFTPAVSAYSRDLQHGGRKMPEDKPF